MLINKIVLNHLRLCRRELQVACRLEKGKWKHIDTKVSNIQLFVSVKWNKGRINS